MRDWLDAIPNFGVPGVPGVPPQKTAGCGGTPGKTPGVPGVPEQRKSANALTSADSVVSAVSHVPRPNDANDPNGTLRFSPAVRLREWHSKLEPLAERLPPEGIRPDRWHELVADSWWVYESFCSQLVRQGWSDLDIFGIVPDELHLGGIIARLYGARNLKLEGMQAIWSRNGRRDWACAGGTDCLATKGVRPLWEVRQ